MKHTGKLTAIVNGIACDFDGDAWWTPDDGLRALLNDATDSTSKTHIDIKQLAQVVLRKVNLWNGAQIIEVHRDADDSQLPEGAIE